MQSERYGFHKGHIATDRFELLLISNFDRRSIKTLHVYLEGDGSPWFMRIFKSRDPTPRHALMLELMSHDNTPSIYLGRPCYNERRTSAGCNPEVWTSGRYSAGVLESMLAAITQEAERLGVQDITLFGHSGGGTLALLLAEKLSSASRVVTLAGNLDTDAWTEHHSLERLGTSLNPAERPALRAQLEQIHFVAGNDKNIPPALVRDWIVRQQNAYGVYLAEYDHGCCWGSLWPGFLQALQQGGPYKLPGEVFKSPVAHPLNQGSQ